MFSSDDTAINIISVLSEFFDNKQVNLLRKLWYYDTNLFIDYLYRLINEYTTITYISNLIDSVDLISVTIDNNREEIRKYMITKVVSLCCSGNCPTITLDTVNNQVIITDDYEGKVTLTPTEFELAYKQYLELVVSSIQPSVAIE